MLKCLFIDMATILIIVSGIFKSCPLATAFIRRIYISLVSLLIIIGFSAHEKVIAINATLRRFHQAHSIFTILLHIRFYGNTAILFNMNMIY